jgi:hypothetical protein
MESPALFPAGGRLLDAQGVGLGARTAVLTVLVVVGAPACAAGTGPRSPTPTPTPTPTPNASGCVTGRTVVTWLPDKPSPPQLCAHVGAQVVVVLHATDAAGRWQPPVSSDPQVATVGPAGTSQEGAISTTVYPRRPGTAVISSYTLFSGDPHGPMSRGWRLVLDVVP